MIEYSTDKDNKLVFSVKASNGDVFVKSIAFDNKKDLNITLQNLVNVKKNRNIFERKTNFEGKFLFNVKKLSGEIVAKSEPYSSEAGMENGIKNFKNCIDLLSDT